MSVVKCLGSECVRFTNYFWNDWHITYIRWSFLYIFSGRTSFTGYLFQIDGTSMWEEQFGLLLCRRCLKKSSKMSNLYSFNMNDYSIPIRYKECTSWTQMIICCVNFWHWHLRSCKSSIFDSFFSDNAQFTRTVFSNRQNNHVRAEENLRALQYRGYQYRFLVEVWAGILRQFNRPNHFSKLFKWKYLFELPSKHLTW